MCSTGWFLLALLGTVSCALGADVDNYNDIKYYLFTRDNREGVEINQDVSNILRSGWNSHIPTKVIVFGWMNTLKSSMPTTVISAFLEAEDDYNVIAVDWSKYADIMVYPLARAHVKGVGTATANFLEFLIKQELLKRESLHVIGHSLGAHVAGNVGKAMAETSGKIRRITGLDPAGPNFYEESEDRLSADDAEVVDVIHTNAGGSGTTITMGLVDFFVNGGTKQPGCLLDFTGQCDHNRSFELFAESILNKNAFRNATLKDSSQNPTSSGEVAQMGLSLNFSRPGSYSLETGNSSPYNLGTQPNSDSGSIFTKNLLL